MKNRTLITCFLFLVFIISGCASKLEKKEEARPPVQEVKKEIKKTIYENVSAFLSVAKQKKIPLQIPPYSKIDTIKIDSIKKSIEVNFSGDFASIPFRPENVSGIYASVKENIGKDYEGYSLSINTARSAIEDLIPNYYRSKDKLDLSRLSKLQTLLPIPVVDNISKPFSVEKGLYNRNIVLWQSHGWYYENSEDRWEWQRPRLFEAVEDKIPMSFTIPYLIPMLENAGANVFVPRERDIQTNEVITDNDGKTLKSKKPEYKETVKNKKLKWTVSAVPGFAYGNPPYAEGYNPFQHGTVRSVAVDTSGTAEAQWIPEVPETGDYAVYISYAASQDNASDALYTVFHSGGKTEFHVNQKIGGSTWIYLGKFRFIKGYNSKECKVTLSNKSKDKSAKFVSADAVRFGGGMGIVSRNGFTSGRPKFLEGSRYWLQFAGMPDTLVYNFNNNRNDYNDDYMSRGEYANYLNGAPCGPSRDKDNKGLGIPIDLSMAFHTDAGITKNDTTIGTLSIYTLRSQGKTTFPSGVSRYANRDIADLVLTQVVDDLRKTYDPAWNSRQLRDGNYYESRSPNIPSLLIELLSHQNFLDMKYTLDPGFRFQVSRAMYKGILRFLATQNNFEYVVQPLPVDHFQALLDEKGSVHLKWQPVTDSLEETASAEKYIVYTRINEGDFDNGTLCLQPSLTVPDLKPGAIYSFKVTAVNKGGESFPSEILSAGFLNNGKKPVLIVNSFDRICGPGTVENDQIAGFVDNMDAGVADKYLINYTGSQYDYSPKSGFVTNDAPGHGASHSDCETLVIAGNSFDYPFIHGKAIKECGFSFSSSSDEAVNDGQVNMKDFRLVDLILGEEKETHWQKPQVDILRGTRFKAFPAAMQSAIRAYCQAGGNMFISGAYVASDLFKNKGKDSTDIFFGKNVLKINLAADHAAKNGAVYSPGILSLPKMSLFRFNTSLNPEIYSVEAPDAINPAEGAQSVLRYDENKFSAATAYKKDYGMVVFGFPFETILSGESRLQVMKSVFNYLGVK